MTNVHAPVENHRGRSRSLLPETDAAGRLQVKQQITHGFSLAPYVSRCVCGNEI